MDQVQDGFLFGPGFQVGRHFPDNVTARTKGFDQKSTFSQSLLVIQHLLEFIGQAINGNGMQQCLSLAGLTLQVPTLLLVVDAFMGRVLIYQKECISALRQDVRPEKNSEMAIRKEGHLIFPIRK